jgi:hypothetical protein
MTRADEKRWPRNRRIPRTATSLSNKFSWSHSEKQMANEIVRLCELIIDTEVQIIRTSGNLNVHKPRSQRFETFFRSTGQRKEHSITHHLSSFEKDTLQLQSYKEELDLIRFSLIPEASKELVTAICVAAHEAEWSLPQNENLPQEAQREIEEVRAQYMQRSACKARLTEIISWLNQLYAATRSATREATEQANKLIAVKLSKQQARDNSSAIVDMHAGATDEDSRKKRAREAVEQQVRMSMQGVNTSFLNPSC